MKIAVFWVVNFYQTTRCYNPEDSNIVLLFLYLLIYLLIYIHAEFSVLQHLSALYKQWQSKIEDALVRHLKY
jgi:hypothetical protein